MSDLHDDLLTRLAVLDQVRAERTEQEEAKEAAYQRIYKLMRERDQARALLVRCADRLFYFWQMQGPDGPACQWNAADRELMADLRAAGVEVPP